MSRVFLIVGAAAAGLAVLLGAFGAHTLGNRIGEDRLSVFETGVRYQMYHALALIGLSWAVSQWAYWQVNWAGYLFMAGILLFSGSLYLLVLTDTPAMGAITPFGGVAFILGWAFLVWAAVSGS